MIANVSNTLEFAFQNESGAMEIRHPKPKNYEIKKTSFPSFAFNIAQLCKVKRRTTAIYRLAEAAGGWRRKKR